MYSIYRDYVKVTAPTLSNWYVMNMNERNADQYRVLRRMAALVLKNPNITVREIAERLGYSEEKSVYYWLEKARFKGIKDFRNSVLTGKVPPGLYVREGEHGAFTGDVQDAASSSRFLGLPVKEQFPLKGPAERQLRHYLPASVGPDSYLIPAPRDLPSAAIRKGDLLLVDPARPPGESDLLVALSEPGELLLLRRYTSCDGRPLVVSVADPGKPVSDATIIGKVLLIIRTNP